jgi:hypothetical protein
MTEPSLPELEAERERPAHDEPLLIPVGRRLQAFGANDSLGLSRSPLTHMTN